jgi:hypothetical protein
MEQGTIRIERYDQKHDHDDVSRIVRCWLLGSNSPT